MPKINSIYQEKLAELGVTPDVYTSKVDPVDYISAIETEGFKCSIEDQKKAYFATLKNPLNKNYLYYINSVGGNPTFAKLVAASIAQAALEIPHTPKIKWLRVTSNKYQSYLEKDRFNEVSPDILFILLFSPNSGHSKLENLFDVLDVYSYIPRIVMFSEMDAVEATRRLGMKPNKILQVSSKISKVIHL